MKVGVSYALCRAVSVASNMGLVYNGGSINPFRMNRWMKP